MDYAVDPMRHRAHRVDSIQRIIDWWIMAKQTLSARQSVVVGVTLFSMFFGAGNLILPPLLGLQAGTDTIPAALGFLVAAIGLPVLGIIAVALAGTARDLAGRVHPMFARVFVAAVYLAIGPCLAIPRTSSTAFEMLEPLLPASLAVDIPRLIFSVAFFALAYVLAMHPGAPHAPARPCDRSGAYPAHRRGDRRVVPHAPARAVRRAGTLR